MRSQTWSELGSFPLGHFCPTGSCPLVICGPSLFPGSRGDRPVVPHPAEPHPNRMATSPGQWVQLSCVIQMSCRLSTGCHPDAGSRGLPGALLRLVSPPWLLRKKILARSLTSSPSLGHGVSRFWKERKGKKKKSPSTISNMSVPCLQVDKKLLWGFCFWHVFFSLETQSL